MLKKFEEERSFLKTYSKLAIVVIVRLCHSLDHLWEKFYVLRLEPVVVSWAVGEPQRPTRPQGIRLTTAASTTVTTKTPTTASTATTNKLWSKLTRGLKRREQQPQKRNKSWMEWNKKEEDQKNSSLSILKIGARLLTKRQHVLWPLYWNLTSRTINVRSYSVNDHHIPKIYLFLQRIAVRLLTCRTNYCSAEDWTENLAN